MYLIDHLTIGGSIKNAFLTPNVLGLCKESRILTPPALELFRTEVRSRNFLPDMDRLFFLAAINARTFFDSRKGQRNLYNSPVSIGNDEAMTSLGHPSLGHSSLGHPSSVAVGSPVVGSPVDRRWATRRWVTRRWVTLP